MSGKIEKEFKHVNDEKLKRNGESQMFQLQKNNDQNPELQIQKTNEEKPMFQIIKLIDELEFADDESNEDEDEHRSEEKSKVEKEEPKIVRTVAYFAVGPKSRRIICPFCGEHVKTKSRPGCMIAVSKLIAACLCLCCCGICCWCLACFCKGCCPQLFTKYRFCPECESYLGYYRRPEL